MALPVNLCANFFLWGLWFKKPLSCRQFPEYRFEATAFVVER